MIDPDPLQTKTENLVRFFAMEASGQIAYLGKLPHDHGHPRFDQDPGVIRFKMLADNFLESYSTLASKEGVRSGIEQDMRQFFGDEIDKPNSTALWSEHGLQRQYAWRVLRILAREALARAGVESIPPTKEVDILACR